MANPNFSPKTKYVIDAHALLWFLEGNPASGANAFAILSDATTELILPVIALAEACWAVERGRTSIPTVQDLIASVDADPRMSVSSLDQTTIERSLTLMAVGEMHDRQIVATALLLQNQDHTVALLLKDQNIVASQLVPVVW